MPKKSYKAEDIINLLRQVEILTSQGQTLNRLFYLDEPLAYADILD